MANLFEQYGIKEVADVTLYKIIDTNGVITEQPYLFLDSLKVSTLEQTAEQAEARGGKGNSPLIIWDYGKEINVTLEDALYSPKSMALMFGGGAEWTTSTATITKTKKARATSTAAPAVYNDQGALVTADLVYYNETGASTTSFVSGEIYIAQWTVAATGARTLTIAADGFPGVFKLVGDTYARNKNTGEDEYFQFIIERAKMSSENTLTLEAEGDPSTFNLNMRVLRPDNGQMMKLIQYTL